MNLDIVRHITAHELARLKSENADIQVIDIREADELDICNLGGYHIPLGQIDVRADEIAKEKPVIIHCKSGRRGEMAVLFLQQNHGFNNLYNLADGIIGYAVVDPSITIY